VDGIKSSLCAVTFGVPQGSVLGPALFLIYIIDIFSNVQGEIRLFADDILLYRPINTPRDHDILQEDLDVLIKWSNDWKMEFNISKCNVMQVTTNQNVSPFSYKMCNMPLNIVEEHDYLVHQKLSWTPHISSKANCLLGFLKCNLYHATQHIKEHVYKQLLLPSIKYCSALWDPYHRSDVSKLEMIRHHSARFILNKPWHRGPQNDSVTCMLHYLQWPTLEY